MQTKSMIDAFAAMTPAAAVDQLFTIPEHLTPEPIDPQTMDYFVNQGTEALTANNGLKKLVIAWWSEEARKDTSISHKLEFFLHSIFITSFKEGQALENFDYLTLFRMCSTNFKNGSFEMGSLKNLALKMVTDNVMIKYLNGRSNVKGKPNENFAREFFELFTIGKGLQIGPGNYTNYTEDDIVAAAKVLTGWINKKRIFGPGGDPEYRDPDTGMQRALARYNKHDTTDKQFSAAFDNKLITGAVDQEDMWRELKDFVDMIFDQDATAVSYCRRMYTFFVSAKVTPEIEEDIIQPMAETLLSNDYHIESALRQLLQSRHFYDEDDGNKGDEIIGGSVKSPFEIAMHTLSFFNIESPDRLTDTDNHYKRWYRLTFSDIILTQGALPIFYPNNVAGYPAYYQEPNFKRNWFTTTTLISRYKLADILLTGKRVLAGGNNGGVQLDIVDFIDNSGVVSNPYSASALVSDLTNYLLATEPMPDRASYFLDVFLDDLSPINWDFEWGNYKTTGNSDAIRIPLETLFRTLISSQEYQLM